MCLPEKTLNNSFPSLSHTMGKFYFDGVPSKSASATVRIVVLRVLTHRLVVSHCVLILLVSFFI